MTQYADTGFICSLYAPDANTESVCSYMESLTNPVYFSWLNQVEYRNAMRLRVFRKEITPDQKDRSINLLLADLNAGIFTHASIVQSELLLETERLSARYTEDLSTRSLDIIHVAVALLLGADLFLSFDARQVQLAKAAGLTVPVLSLRNSQRVE